MNPNESLPNYQYQDISDEKTDIENKSVSIVESFDMLDMKRRCYIV